MAFDPRATRIPEVVVWGLPGTRSELGRRSRLPQGTHSDFIQARNQSGWIQLVSYRDTPQVITRHRDSSCLHARRKLSTLRPDRSALQPNLPQ